MKPKEPTFIIIEPENGRFRAFLSIEGLLSIGREPQPTLQKAVEQYEHAVTTMRSLIGKMQLLRVNRKPIPSRMMWKLGDIIFQLRDGLQALSLELDGLYTHLVRDLGVKRKWLEKAIIFRRYLPEVNLIPESLNWGRCEKGTRRVAERLRGGLPLG